MQQTTHEAPAQPVGRWALIDVANWAHKLIHAIGEPDRAFATLKRWHATIAAGTNAERYVLAFDSPSDSFRRKAHPGYKANRPDPPPGVSELIDAAHAWGIAEGFDVVSAAGFEADDLIATITAVAVMNQRQVIICSTDKDLRQLLRDGWVVIARNVSAAKGIEWYNQQQLADDYGLQPSQWIDYQSLVGDSTDNVAGCNSIGDKTAREILRTCGTLEGHYANPWRAKLNAKQRAALSNYRKDGLGLARKLVTLRTDAPIGEGWVTP